MEWGTIVYEYVLPVVVLAAVALLEKLLERLGSKKEDRDAIRKELTDLKGDKHDHE